MSKGFWAVIAALVLIFIGIAVFSGDKGNSSSGSNKNKGALSQNVMGPENAAVVLLEYGDYQCPYCLQYFPTVKAITEEYKDKIRFQFRHFPLVGNHPNAFAAARAAEAAALQDKFWEMHDELYDPSNNAVWTPASNPNVYFEQYAKKIGLNVEQYKKDFASSTVNDIINADMAEGNRQDVSSTPTFFINGKKVAITNDLKAFQQIINSAIAQKASASDQ